MRAADYSRPVLFGDAGLPQALHEDFPVRELAQHLAHLAEAERGAAPYGR
jgi:hypothetical protein